MSTLTTPHIPAPLVHCSILDPDLEGIFTIPGLPDFVSPEGPEKPKPDMIRREYDLLSVIGPNHSYGWLGAGCFLQAGSAKAYWEHLFTFDYLAMIRCSVRALSNSVLSITTTVGGLVFFQGRFIIANSLPHFRHLVRLDDKQKTIVYEQFILSLQPETYKKPKPQLSKRDEQEWEGTPPLTRNGRKKDYK